MQFVIKRIGDNKSYVSSCVIELYQIVDFIFAVVGMNENAFLKFIETKLF